MPNLYTQSPSTHWNHTESRVGVHDRNHFELKLDYSAPEDQPESEYHVDAYFFVPASLGINSSTYPKESFYNDVQGYVRLKTPTVPFSALLDIRNEQSPLILVERGITDSGYPHDLTPETAQALCREMKLLGCLVRTNVRDGVDGLLHRIEELNRQPDEQTVLLSDTNERALRFTRGAERLLQRYRVCRIDASSTPTPDAVSQTFRAVDEYMSWIIEWGATRLVNSIDGAPALGDALADARRAASECIVAERTYRRGAGYTMVREEADARHEHFLYRTGLLKKFVTSLLWLDVSRAKEGETLSNVGAALAAGVAMFVAVTATVFQTKWLLINSWSFVTAAVITYMFKDRIKDYLKGKLNSKLSSWVADYSMQIKDPTTGATLGVCREAFAHLSASRVPHSIREVRMHGTERWIEDREKPEIVFKYEKYIRLAHGAVGGRLHQEHHDINDIIRFDVSRFLTRADDPTSQVLTYVPERDRVELVEYAKVYHLNIVLVMTAKGQSQPCTVRRVRVVLDKAGIVRLEDPGLPLAAVTVPEIGKRLIRNTSLPSLPHLPNR